MYVDGGQWRGPNPPSAPARARVIAHESCSLGEA